MNLACSKLLDAPGCRSNTYLLLPTRFAERPGWGYFLPGFQGKEAAVPAEPAAKRAVVFIDGQNPFRCAKGGFGYHSRPPAP
jgi:hypothetical protein